MEICNHLFLLAMWLVPFCSLLSFIGFPTYLWCLFRHLREIFPETSCARAQHAGKFYTCAKPSQAEEGGKPLPMELMGCSGWGSWRNVINTACTLTTAEILSEAQGGVWARTCSPGKELPSFRVRATCHAQPSPQWAAVHSLCAVCTAFLSRMIFGFFYQAHIVQQTPKVT